MASMTLYGIYSTKPGILKLGDTICVNKYAVAQNEKVFLEISEFP